MPDEVSRKSVSEITDSIVQVLQSLYTATKTVLIYPAENPSVVRMVEGAHGAITGLVPMGGALDLSFIEDKLIINGEMLDDSLQKRGIIQSFHELMKARRISSITFWDGLTKDELRKFLIILGTKAPGAGAEEQVDVDHLLEGEGVEHIEVDEQIYVAISKREKVVDARVAVEREGDAALKALKDEVFARFLAGDVSLSDVDSDTVKEIMADPDRMVSMVQGVVTAQGWDSEVESLPFRIDETMAILERISGLVGQVDDPLVRSKLNREISKITSQVETPQLTEMLLKSSGLEGTASELPSVVLPLLEDQKLTAVVESVVGEYRKLSSSQRPDDWPSRRMVELRSILTEAMSSASGELAKRLEGVINEAGTEEEGEAGASLSGVELARGLMSGADAGSLDTANGPALVVATRYLFENDRDDLGQAAMSRLAGKFRAQSPETKGLAAQQIWGLFQALRTIGKETFAGDFIDEVMQTMDEERSAAESFSGLTRSLEEVSAEAGMSELLGAEPSPEGSSPMSTVAVEKLMSADTGKVVQAVFRSGDRSAQDAITRVLLGMEERAVPALVDAAADAAGEEELGGIADSLRKMETDPMPNVASKLSGELTPQQMVNIIRLVALVGNESSVSVFNPLMLVEDPVIVLEVIRALGRLGGKQALQMELSESASPDPVLRAAAVRELGRFRDYMAVRRLVEVISPRKKGEPPEDEAVMIAACRSLGDLRVRQAAPNLIEIARGGRRHEYSEELRAVATGALGMVGGDEAVKVLRQMLKDRSMLVRSTARKALGGA